MCKDKLVIANANGESINVTLQADGLRQVGTLLINGLRYHIENMPLQEFCSNYRVDNDKAYDPQTDASGCCVIIAPFSR